MNCADQCCYIAAVFTFGLLYHKLGLGGVKGQLGCRIKVEALPFLLYTSFYQKSSSIPEDFAKKIDLTDKRLIKLRCEFY